MATGVVSREMPGFPFNGSTVIGSKQAMVLPQQPKDIIVIGAGAIGIEFAYFFNAFGTKVTVVEMLPNILPIEDTEVSVTLEKALTKQGMKILAGTKVEKAEATDKGVKLTVSGKASETDRGGRRSGSDRSQSGAPGWGQARNGSKGLAEDQ